MDGMDYSTTCVSLRMLVYTKRLMIAATSFRLLLNKDPEHFSQIKPDCKPVQSPPQRTQIHPLARLIKATRHLTLA